MFKIKGKDIFLNRGDEVDLRLTLKDDEKFQASDYLKLNIVKKNDYSTVIFSKTFTVEEDCGYFDITLTSEETRLGDVLKTGTREYWYEIELNGKITLIGADEEGDKKFVLYPEAEQKVTE